MSYAYVISDGQAYGHTYIHTYIHRDKQNILLRCRFAPINYLPPVSGYQSNNAIYIPSCVRSRFAKVTVYVPPDDPIILQVITKLAAAIGGTPRDRD